MPSTMESEEEPGRAGAAMTPDAAASSRSAIGGSRSWLADRAIAPCWYHPAFGLLAGGVIAGAEIRNWALFAWSVAAYTAGCGVLVLLYTPAAHDHVRFAAYAAPALKQRARAAATRRLRPPASRAKAPGKHAVYLRRPEVARCRGRGQAAAARQRGVARVSGPSGEYRGEVTGLTWLADRPNVGSWPFCLTFVRGATEREVLEGFGAEGLGADANAPDAPDDAGAAIPSGEVHDRPRVMVGRSGEWIFALEETMTAQGTRPEVLRRLSARTEAVAIYNDIGKGNDEFAHAYNGEIITAVTTAIPPHWWGSEPDRLRSLAEEIALDDDGESGLLGLEVLLALAEGVFGISLSEEDLSRPHAAVPVLPVLDDLPAPWPDGARPRVSDPVISLLLAHVPGESLTRTCLSAAAGSWQKQGSAVMPCSGTPSGTPWPAKPGPSPTTNRSVSPCARWRCTTRRPPPCCVLSWRDGTSTR
jgi:hypothetical protein